MVDPRKYSVARKQARKNSFISRTGQFLEDFSAIIVAIDEKNVAIKAGINSKDIILSINGKTVGTAREITGMIADTGVGETVKIKVLRNGKGKTFKVKIAKREDAKISARKTRKEHQAELGIRVAEVTPDIARRLNLKEAKGVIVAGVEPDSKAAEAGLRVHDIIKEVNHLSITSVSDLNKAINNIKDGETINMFIWRMNRGFLIIKITK